MNIIRWAHFIALFICLSCGSFAAEAKEACSHNWVKGHYKSFRQIEQELSATLGEIKILRMAICGTDPDRFFSITFLNHEGTVKTVRVPAR